MLSKIKESFVKLGQALGIMTGGEVVETERRMFMWGGIFPVIMGLQNTKALLADKKDWSGARVTAIVTSVLMPVLYITAIIFVYRNLKDKRQIQLRIGGVNVGPYLLTWLIALGLTALVVPFYAMLMLKFVSSTETTSTTTSTAAVATTAGTPVTPIVNPSRGSNTSIGTTQNVQAAFVDSN